MLGAGRTNLDHRDGRIVNANLSDYLVPVIVAASAAIANAVFNAAGDRVTDLPITLEKLL